MVHTVIVNGKRIKRHVRNVKCSQVTPLSLVNGRWQQVYTYRGSVRVNGQIVDVEKRVKQIYTGHNTTSSFGLWSAR